MNENTDPIPSVYDLKDFSNATVFEHQENLKRLNISKYSELVGKLVHYSRPVYGIHTVIKWDIVREEFLLGLDGDRFYSSPFRVLIIQNI